MTIKKLANDDSGLTVAVESIILFSISILVLGMIFMTFQGLTQKQNKIMIEEELKKIGNTIARKISDMDIEARASNAMGSHTTIKTEFQIPDRIGDSSYKIILLDGNPGKIILESSGDPYVRVEVPVHKGVRLANNHTIYSMDDEYAIEYDSLSSQMYFTNGGEIPFPDFNAPTISFESPDEGVNISNSTYINTTAWDDVGVTRVEFYVRAEFDVFDVYKYSVTEPYDWLWDTREDIDGNYTVTALAYDAAGNTKIAIRNFTVYNPFPYPPRISEISPPDLSFTDFKKPIIKAKITDNNPLNISSINLTVDGFNVTANSTISYITFPKVVSISYTPLENMENGTHIVNLSVTDLNPDIPGAQVMTNWTFNVTTITDIYYPTVSITNPIVNASLVSGNYINITFQATDVGSGLENFSINIMRGDGVWTNYSEQLSIYPDVVYDTYPTTWTSPNQTYVGGMNYTFNITVFDRSGNSSNASKGPFFIYSNQAQELEVNTSGNSTTGSGRNLWNIRIKDNTSNSIIPVITQMQVSWTGASGSRKINSVAFDGVNKWTGNVVSGTMLNINPDHTTQETFQSMDMVFSFDVRGRTITIIFYLADGTSVTTKVYP